MLKFNYKYQLVQVWTVDLYEICDFNFITTLE